MINFKQIEAFILVAEEGNFTKAAKALYMTQPAISFQIKALEEHFATKLFERLEKKAELTEAGRLFYPEAKNIIASYERARDALDELQNLSRGRIDIGASTIPGEYMLPLAIGGFKGVYPGIKINLNITDSGQAVEDILTRKIDLAVVGAVYPSESLDYKLFAEDEIIFILPPAHPLAGEVIGPEELAREEFVLREAGSGTRKVITDKLANLGLAFEQLKVAMEVGSTRAVITAVEAGLGLGVVSRWAARDALQLGLVKELSLYGFEGKRELYIVSNNTKYLDKAAKTFVDYLGEFNQTLNPLRD